MTKKKNEFKEKLQTNLNIEFDFSKFAKLENIQIDDIKDEKNFLDNNIKS